MTKQGSGQDLSNFSMMDLFRTEAESQVAILNDGLLALEQDATAASRLEALMRAAHSLKGAARIVGIDPLVQLAHAMEDCFVAAQKGQITIGPEQADVLLAGVDLLARLSKEPNPDSPGQLAPFQPQIDAVLARLSAVKTASQMPAPVVSANVPQARAAVEPAAVAAATPTRPAPAPEKPPVAPPQPPSPPPVDVVVVAAASKAADAAERAVRVSAESLTRMMGLAGESLVQSRRLDPSSLRIRALVNQLSGLSRTVDKLEETLAAQNIGWRPAQLLAETRQQTDDCNLLARDWLDRLDLYARQLSDVSGRLYREVVASRMRPFGDGVTGFPRFVRDMARQMGKKVRFEILGKSTKVDRDILDKLEGPLTHLLRNSLDHGLETPDARQAAGKTPEGLLRLEAFHHAGQLHITMTDDGCGIDLERVRRKVVAKGLTTEEIMQGLSEAELLDFLFLPGFSTAEIVTEISGRGVGLDAVRDLAQQLGGSISVENRPGHGASFHLRLPVTLSVIRVLLMDVSGEPFAIPLNRIDRLLHVSSSDIQTLEGRRYVVSDGRNIGLVSAHEVLGLPGSDIQGNDWPIVVIGDVTLCYGLVVDRFIGQSELVVRPLDPRLGKVPDVSSASLMEDGTPVLILDAEDLKRSIGRLLSDGQLKKIHKADAEAELEARKRVLVVDDSITVRQLERALLANRGYDVEIATDGMDAWNSIRLETYDLIVTDVDMPRMNGIDLVRHIRQDARVGDVPIIIVSYKDRPEDRLQGLEVGANTYLTKSSFHDESFIKAVMDLIGEP